jgi:cytochrome c2
MLANRNKRYYWVTGVVFILLLFCFSSFYAQRSSSEQSHWKGRDIFEKKGCIECHSIYDKGGKGGPDLGKQKFYGTYLELSSLMWNHFPKMFKKMQKTGYQFSEFTDEEMSQLIAYISFIRYMGEPGNEYKGKKLLKSKGCLSCHKFGGVGEDIGPDISDKEEYLSPIALLETMWNHGPNMMGLFEKYDIKRPEFKGNEIVDIAVAIRSYMSPTKVPVGSFDLGDQVKGKKLSAEKGCLHCHSIRGEGGTLGSDFIEIDFNYSITQIAGNMWNHGPKMWEIMKDEDISFPTFDKGEMADIIAYLYSLKLEDAPGDVEMGSQIVNEKGCLSCHSLQGNGSDIALDLAKLEEMDSPLAMITAMWNHAPAMREKQLEKKLQWPKFNGRDMANLYAYMRFISKSSEDGS